jgi:hypothetical protein
LLLLRRYHLEDRDANGTRVMRSGERYLDAMYWSMTTMTTIGYGDRSPANAQEILFTVVAEVLGLSFFALLLQQVRQNGYLLSRRGRSLPANASGLDTHRDSISSRFDCSSGDGGGSRAAPPRSPSPLSRGGDGLDHADEAAAVAAPSGGKKAAGALSLGLLN